MYCVAGRRYVRRQRNGNDVFPLKMRTFSRPNTPTTFSYLLVAHNSLVECMCTVALDMLSTLLRGRPLAT
jgi:hypothetical protein